VSRFTTSSQFFWLVFSRAGVNHVLWRDGRSVGGSHFRGRFFGGCARGWSAGRKALLSSSYSCMRWITTFFVEEEIYSLQDMVMAKK
jgi:hypothetical protein